MPDLPPPKAVKVVARRVSGVSRTGAAKLAMPADAIRACIEYAKVLEAEKTKRAEIRAKRDVAVAAISAEKEIILKYFGVVQKACNLGNSETA